MPVGRRRELLRYADTVGASIIEDDYDGEFHYEARPISALQGLASSTRVFYLGTFSKSMFADIRIGYIVVPEGLVDGARERDAPDRLLVAGVRSVELDDPPPEVVGERVRRRGLPYARLSREDNGALLRGPVLPGLRPFFERS